MGIFILAAPQAAGISQKGGEAGKGRLPDWSVATHSERLLQAQFTSQVNLEFRHYTGGSDRWEDRGAGDWTHFYMPGELETPPTVPCYRAADRGGAPCLGVKGERTRLQKNSSFFFVKQ